MVSREVKLLCDEHIPFGLISALRNYGIDAVSVQELSLREAPDETIFNLAVSEGYIIVTGNISDFARLLRTRGGQCSIIFIQFKRKRNRRFGEIANEIIGKINTHLERSQIFVDYVDP